MSYIMSKKEVKRAKELLRQLSERPELTGVEIYEWAGNLSLMDAAILCKQFGCSIKILDKKVARSLGTKAIR